MAWELATNQDYYVNESFATSHRERTSICEITKYLPSFLGLHFEKEMQKLSFISQNPKRPLTVIIGGSKLESKLPTIEHFVQSSDYILVGGKLSSSPDLPSNPKIIRAVDTNQGLDIGEKSVLEFSKVISQSQTIFWSGPLGKVEEKPFAESSLKVSEAIIKSHAFSVVGGGDTISFLEKNNLLDSFSFVSVGGSALLEYLSTGTLVGIEYYKKYGQKNT
jgi:phosphoglycerate kinase